MVFKQSAQTWSTQVNASTQTTDVKLARGRFSVSTKTHGDLYKHVTLMLSQKATGFSLHCILWGHCSRVTDPTRVLID